MRILDKGADIAGAVAAIEAEKTLNGPAALGAFAEPKADAVSAARAAGQRG